MARQKGLRLLLASTAFWLASAGTAGAVPVSYTFDGQIFDAYDEAGILGASVGNPVTYTFIVDTGATGYTTQSGARFDKSDYSGFGTSIDYFLASYFSGSLVDPGNNGFFLDPEIFNYGLNQSDSSGNKYSALRGGSWNSSIHIDAWVPFSDLVVGSSVVGRSELWLLAPEGGASAYNYSYLSANLILTDVTTVGDGSRTAVPEPGTMLLLASGLVGVVGTNRKRRKK